jgi:hypothetical protein
MKEMKMKQLRQKKVAAMAQLTKAKAAKQQAADLQVGEMNKQWKMFCQTLRMPYWNKAQKIYSKLDKMGFNEPLLKANTKELYVNAFNFNSIATNDDSVAIMSDLDTAQNNLNANPNNEILLKKYVDSALGAAKELHSRYSDFWNDPAEGVLAETKDNKKDDDDESDDDDE